MELTKEYFDEQLNNLNKRLDDVPINETISVLQTDVAGLKSDMSGLKTDIQTVKEDIVALQDDMRSVKNDVSEIKQTVAELNRRDKEDSDAFAKSLVKHDDRLSKVEQEIKELKLNQA